MAPAKSAAERSLMLAEPPSTEFETKQRVRRTWLKFSAAVGLLLIGALLIGCLDEEPPNDEDFRLEPLKLADGENAYFRLSHAAQQLPDPLWTYEEQDMIEAMRKGTDWNDSLAQKGSVFVKRLWPEILAAVETPNSQAPWAMSYSDVFTEVGDIRSLSDCVVIHARAQCRSGDADDALNTAITLLAVGDKIEESRGCLIHFLTGASCKSTALGLIEEIVASPAPTPAALKNALSKVRTSRPSLAGIKVALDTEYRVASDALVKRMPLAGAADSLDSAFLKYGPLIPGLFKLNQTRREYLEHMRRPIAVIDQPLADLNTRGGAEELKRELRKNPLTHPMNSIGRAYLATILPSTSGLLNRRLFQQSRFSATEALLAIRLYQRAHDNALPPTLDALVPDYLPAVPRDYFDGQPIRYSRDLGVLWSAGENNLAITSADQEIEQREIVIYLKPRPPILTHTPASETSPRTNAVLQSAPSRNTRPHLRHYTA